MLYELSEIQKIQEKLKVVKKPSSSRISEVAHKPQGICQSKLKGLLRTLSWSRSLHTIESFQLLTLSSPWYSNPLNIIGVILKMMFYFFKLQKGFMQNLFSSSEGFSFSFFSFSTSSFSFFDLHTLASICRFSPITREFV